MVFSSKFFKKFKKLLFILIIFLLLLTPSTVKAQTWTTREQVSTTPTGGLVVPIMFSSDNSGTFYAIWLQYNSGSQDGAFFSKKIGGIWTNPQPIPLPFTPNTQINAIVSSDGTVHVAALGDCCSAFFVWVYTQLPANGTVWSPYQIINTDFGTPGNASLAAASDGTVYIVYAGAQRGTSNPRQMIYQKRDPQTGNWSSPQNITPNALNANYGSLALDSTGVLNLAWYDYNSSTGDYRSYYTKLAPGETWTASELIFNSTTITDRLLVDQNQNLHLFFFSSLDGKVLSYTSRSSSGQWAQAEVLTNYQIHPSEALSSDGTLYLVYENGQGQVQFRSKPANSPWGPISVPATYTTNLGFVAPKVLADNLNRPHIIFGDGQVYHIQQANQQPTANAGADQTVVVNNQVTLDGSASFDPDFDSLTYSWSEDSNNPQTNILSSSGAVNPTFMPTIAGVYQFSLVVNDGLVNSAPDSVTIIVQTPTQAIQNLVNTVEQFNLQHGIENSLDAKLSAANQALSDANQHNNSAAINSLQAFINAVEAQRGHSITNAQADQLIAMAQAIINSLLAS